MKFLPFENITYKSKLKEEEVMKRLIDFVEPQKTFRFSWFEKPSKPYEGRIIGQSFEISRIINYRNSFLPRITGLISPDYNGGTIIKVKMRLHVLVLLFMLIWFIGVGLAFIVSVTLAISTLTLNAQLLIPSLMLVFMYALSIGAFKYESRKTKNDLKQLFEAEIVEI